ncbi:MAG: pseudaminic acid synthase [Ignavibacteriae bacterium]|nr:pseudaminic acid synthase [Ignavibacteriota bacterium]
MKDNITIDHYLIGGASRAFIIAEISANHNQHLGTAINLINASKASGADAVKFQTYTADTITFRSDKEYFRIAGGTLWDGRTLHDLYREAYTPWEWFPELFAAAREAGLLAFSTPFDDTAVDFLERLDPPAYKVASLELVDLPLLDTIARTGKPILMSTGAATLEEIDEAMEAIAAAGAEEVALLKCTSAYPAKPDDMHLATIPDLAQRYRVPVGLSDHSTGIAVPVAAVALGARIIEKHLTMHRSDGGPDSAFSLEPDEFRAMVDAVRVAEKAIGHVNYTVQDAEAASRSFRRSLFVVAPVRAGEVFTRENVRSIRPAHGIAPKHLAAILGGRALYDIEAGTPLSWDMIERA